MSELFVSELNVYPVKSCAGIPMDEVTVGPRGFQYDREWMVTRPNGTFMTARNFPALPLVETALTGEALRLSAPGHGEIEVPLDAEATRGNPEIDVDVFKKRGKGVFQGQDAADFFSDFLSERTGRKVGAMLLRVSQPRTVKPEGHLDGFGTEIGFADGAPILLASEVSLRALAKVAGRPINKARIRANMWVNGKTEAYDEDYWYEFQAGELEAAVGWPCGRCPMPDVDPTTGILPKPDERFVTRALRESRAGIDPSSGQQEVFFAQNVVRRAGPDLTIRVGDRLTVMSRSDERNFQPLPAVA